MGITDFNTRWNNKGTLEQISMNSNVRTKFQKETPTNSRVRPIAKRETSKGSSVHMKPPAAPPIQTNSLQKKIKPKARKRISVSNKAPAPLPPLSKNPLKVSKGKKKFKFGNSAAVNYGILSDAASLKDKTAHTPSVSKVTTSSYRFGKRAAAKSDILSDFDRESSRAFVAEILAKVLNQAVAYSRLLVADILDDILEGAMKRAEDNLARHQGSDNSITHPGKEIFFPLTCILDFFKRHTRNAYFLCFGTLIYSP